MTTILELLKTLPSDAILSIDDEEKSVQEWMEQFSEPVLIADIAEYIYELPSEDEQYYEWITANYKDYILRNVYEHNQD